MPCSRHDENELVLLRLSAVHGLHRVDKNGRGWCLLEDNTFRFESLYTEVSVKSALSLEQEQLCIISTSAS